MNNMKTLVQGYKNPEVGRLVKLVWYQQWADVREKENGKHTEPVLQSSVR